ncbi:MAG: exopolysaccharide biosynthesis protein [Rhizobiaceae bacterium]
MASTFLKPSALVERFTRKLKDRESISIGEISDQLGSTGFGLIIILLSVPALIPIPGPIGLVLGLALAMVSIQVICGAERFWLPDWMRQRQISSETTLRISALMIKWLRPVEALVHPRRMRFMAAPAFKPLYGVPVLLLAVALALPLPLGNVLPCFALIVLALGLMARDGLATMIGLGIGVLALMWTGLLIYAGEQIVEHLLGLFGVI